MAERDLLDLSPVAPIRLLPARRRPTDRPQFAPDPDFDRRYRIRQADRAALELTDLALYAYRTGRTDRAAKMLSAAQVFQRRADLGAVPVARYGD